MSQEIINCKYCDTEIYFNQTKGQYFESKHKDTIPVLHNIIECKQANENKARNSNTNTNDENKTIDNDLTIGYKTLKNSVAYFPKSEPKIYAALSTKKDIANYPNYNKLKIDYFFCVSCHKDTEFTPHETVSNIIKCLVCGTIQLRGVVTN